ncbi:MAG: dehydrogenase [Eubacterium sp.]|nr:dehydrogenase [Eubacterium sp.]
MEKDLNIIFNRRSIRKFQNREVSDELINSLLRAAMSAPSACNQQPWHFVIIRDRTILNQLSDIHGGFNNLKNAPLAILVCGEPKAATLECYWEQDCSAATQNILLAATALGLGAVWQGINPEGGNDSDTLRRLLKLPEHITPFSLIAAGHPAETSEPADRFNTDKIHYSNVW